MKISLLLLTVFSLFLILTFADNKPGNITRIGCTELNGNGCVCHSVPEDTAVHVWVKGPDTVIAGERNLYKMYMTGGPAQGGGYNVACRYGIMDTVGDLSVWDYRDPNELTQAYTLAFPTMHDTVFWPFVYIAPDSVQEDTIYSTGLSCVWDSIPDFLDRWAYGPKFKVSILPSVTSIKEIPNIIPSTNLLEQNYPNPFNPSTKIRFRVPLETDVKVNRVVLKIYDITGRIIKTLINENKSPGLYEIMFSPEYYQLSSGIYFCELRIGRLQETKKMLFIK